MQLHIKVANQSTVTFDDYQDVNALREMADVALRVLDPEMRGQASSNYDRKRAYQMALWIREYVPENARRPQ
jgi:hypothetical protein